MSVSKAIDDISSFNAKQVLIFGGSRFMGHSLTETLLEKGHFVTIVNRGNLYWDDKHDSFSKKYQNQFNQIKINRNDKTKLKTSLENAANRLKPKSFDFIVDYSAYDPDDVSPVVDFAQKQNAHYIFISSDSVYEVSDVEQHKSLDIRVETDAQRPKDPELIKQLRKRDDYGDDKMRCEELLRETPQTMAFTALRLPDVFGPRDNTDRHWSYQLLVKLALNGRPLQIEEKEQRRLLSGVDAYDVTRAILTIMEHPKKCHRESFNIAWREHFTLQTYLNTIAEVLIELSPRVKQKSIQFEVLEPEEENMFHYLPSVTERTGPVSIEKFAKLTNWQPTPFKTSMRVIVEWFEQAWHKFPDKRPHDDDLSETEWNDLKRLYADINKDEL